MPGVMVCFHYCSIVSSLYTTARLAMRSMLGTGMAQFILALFDHGGGGASSLHRTSVPQCYFDTQEGSNRWPRGIKLIQKVACSPSVSRSHSFASNKICTQTHCGKVKATFLFKLTYLLLSLHQKSKVGTTTTVICQLTLKQQAAHRLTVGLLFCFCTKSELLCILLDTTRSVTGTVER